MTENPSRPDRYAFFHTAITSVVGSTHEPNAWWRYLLMFTAIIIGGIILLGTAVTLAVMFLFADDTTAALQALAKASESGLDMSAMGMPPGASLAVVVASFACGLFVLLILIKPLHQRPIRSIITGASRIRWKRIAAGFALWFGVFVILEIINYQLSPSEYTFTFDASTFWPSLVAAIILLPMQTSLEEIAIRGYLMQGLGLATKRPWLALLITSLLFGLLHGANPEVSNYGPLIMIYYIGTGLFLGLITLMDEGLELALGIHFANNLCAASIVSYPSSVFVYPSVYQTNEMDLSSSLVGWFIMASSVTLLFTFLFKWKDWSKIWTEIPELKVELVEEHV